MDQSQLDALLDGPALEPPPGYVSQLDNPPNQKVLSTAVTTVCLALSTFAVAMRLYTKVRVVRKVTIADYSILVAMCVYAGYIAAAFLSCIYVPGVHQWNVRLRDMSPFFYWVHVASILYGVVIFFIKLSILLQYIQIFMPNRSPSVAYWTTIFFLWANFLSYFIFTLTEIWICNPIAKAWDPLVTEGHCLDIMAINVAASSINTVSDFLILILPQIFIWRLNMTPRTKVAVSVLFLIAILACVSSAVRLSYTVKLQYSEDVTWNTFLAGIWTLPEMAFGILVACSPVTKVFIRSLGESKLYSQIASSLKRLKSRTRLNSDQSTSAYALEDHVPQTSRQSRLGDPWARKFGITGLSSLNTAPGSVSTKHLRTSNEQDVSLEEGNSMESG